MRQSLTRNDNCELWRFRTPRCVQRTDTHYPHYFLFYHASFNPLSLRIETVVAGHLSQQWNRRMQRRHSFWKSFFHATWMQNIRRIELRHGRRNPIKYLDTNVMSEIPQQIKNSPSPVYMKALFWSWNNSIFIRFEKSGLKVKNTLV